MIPQTEAARGSNSNFPVTVEIQQLCSTGREDVKDVSVVVVDDRKDGTTIDIVVKVARTSNIDLIRKIMLHNLKELCLSKDIYYDLFVREEGIVGDAEETVWRFFKGFRRIEA